MNDFPNQLFQSKDLILLRHQSCRYVEHLFECEICCVRDGMTIVQVILSHEYCWFYRYSHEHSPNNRMFLSIFCNIWNSFLSFFALDHSPDSRMILIPLTILILFHRFQWQIVVALPLFEDQHRVSPIFHEVLPHSQRIARFHHAELPRERNQVGILVSLPKKLHRVSPIVRTSQYQFSTLEKTKHGFHHTFSSLLRKSFQWIVHDNSSQMRSFGRCRHRVSPVFPLSQQLYSRDFDFHNFSSPGLLKSRMIRSTAPLQWGSSLVLILLWLVLLLILVEVFSPLFQSKL